MSFSTSPATDLIDAAISKIQGEVTHALKDSTNPHFRSKYADLVSVWSACRDSLVKHGVSITQWPVHHGDDRLHLVTRLAVGGQWMMAELSLPVSKMDPQGFGSAITYARRYALAAAVGVVADEDDDGNAASTGGGGTRQAFTVAPNRPSYMVVGGPPEPVIIKAAHPAPVATYPVISQKRQDADPEAKRLAGRLLMAAQEAKQEGALDEFKVILAQQAERYGIPVGEFVGDLSKYSSWLSAVRDAWVGGGDTPLHEADPHQNNPF